MTQATARSVSTVFVFAMVWPVIISASKRRTQVEYLKKKSGEEISMNMPLSSLCKFLGRKKSCGSACERLKCFGRLPLPNQTMRLLGPTFPNLSNATSGDFASGVEAREQIIGSHFCGLRSGSRSIVTSGNIETAHRSGLFESWEIMGGNTNKRHLPKIKGE